MKDYPVGCVGCGWALNLPVVDGLMDITRLEGWTIGEGDSPLCERCSTGWRPSTLLQRVEYLYEKGVI